VQGLVSIVPHVIRGIALAALAALVVYVAGWWLTALVRRHLPSSTFRLMVSLGVIAMDELTPTNRSALQIFDCSQYPDVRRER